MSRGMAFLLGCVFTSAFLFGVAIVRFRLLMRRVRRVFGDDQHRSRERLHGDLRRLEREYHQWADRGCRVEEQDR